MMKNRETMKKLLALILISTCTFGFGQSLDEYLNMAMDSNASLQAGYAKYQAEMAKIPQVKSLPDPELGIGYFIQPVETRVGPQQARASLSQMFPWFGTLNAREQMQAEKAKAEYEQFLQQQNDLQFNVKKVYFQLYLLQEKIAIYEAHREILNTYERLSTTKVESGTGSLADVLRIQMELEEINISLQTLQDQMKPEQASFNRYLNRPAHTPINLPDTLEPKTMLMDTTRIAEQVLQQQHILKGIEHLKASGKADVRVARKMGSPSLGLSLNYIFTGQRDIENLPDNGQDALMPGIKISLPIYRKKYTALTQSAEWRLKAVQGREQDYRNLLKAEVSRWLVQLRDSERRIALYSRQIDKAQQTQRLLVTAYTNNEKGFEDVLEVQRLILKFKLKQMEAIAEQRTAVAGIKRMYE